MAALARRGTAFRAAQLTLGTSCRSFQQNTHVDHRADQRLLGLHLVQPTSQKPTNFQTLLDLAKWRLRRAAWARLNPRGPDFVIGCLVRRAARRHGVRRSPGVDCMHVAGWARRARCASDNAKLATLHGPASSPRVDSALGPGGCPQTAIPAPSTQERLATPRGRQQETPAAFVVNGTLKGTPFLPPRRLGPRFNGDEISPPPGD
jgi:hypothetical protein